MKTIRDIRAYQSDWENLDGNRLPAALDDRLLAVTLHRIVMKLREAEVSLGDFDHLYLNFTTCLPAGTLQPARRSPDRYHPWYRYCDVGVGRETFDRLGTGGCTDFAVSQAEAVLLRFFAPTEELRNIIRTAVEEAVTQGADMRMPFKEKTAGGRKAVLWLRYLDTARYAPLLCVYDEAGREVLREDLPPTLDLSICGELLLSSKKVTVKPRKNAFTQGMEPISFPLKLLEWRDAHADGTTL